MVWFDDLTQDLKYATRDDWAWIISTVYSEGDVGRFPSLALDEQGNPSISCYEQISSGQWYIKFARWGGDKWDIQRVDRLDSVLLGHFGARKTSSLVLGTDDRPIVAYSDERVIPEGWWDGSEWNLETVYTASGTPLGQQVSLAVGGSGALHLTFADVTPKGGAGVKGAVMYALGTPVVS
jgi:hypothetical protein